jgi:hypothetical protein
MNDTYIFSKTLRGADELGNRGSSLSPKHRRCLMLIDGVKTVRDLAAYFRPGELAPLLRELTERGFLEMPAEGLAAIEASTAKIMLIDEARFLEVQRRAMQELQERLGAAGEMLRTQIGACARPEQLRIALRSVEKGLAAQAGADYASDFVRRIGRDLMGS